jgi:Pretoxin HINT domain
MLKNIDPVITFLTLTDSEQGNKSEHITTTPEHPFYVQAQAEAQARPKPMGHEDLSGRWVGAGHLLVEDKIKQVDGTVGVVSNVFTFQQTREMFNLTVSEAHTYYVGQDGWLVHNVQQSQLTLYRVVSEAEYQSILRKGAFSNLYGKGLEVKQFTTSYEAAVEFGRNMGAKGGEPYTRIVATVVKNPNSLSIYIGEAADLTGKKLPFVAVDPKALRTLQPITDLQEILKLVPCR